MKLYHKFMLFLLTMGTYATANAQTRTDATIETVANALIPQIEGIHPLLMGFSYLFGLFLGYKGVMKLKDLEERGQNKSSLAAPIALLVASSMCFALPHVINLGINTLSYDKAGQQTFKY